MISNMSTHISEGTAAERPIDTLPMRLVISRAHAGGLSAREAAFRVGVSGQTWRNWEMGNIAGASKPAMLSYIARQLGVDEEWLRDGGPLQAAENPQPDGPDGGQEGCTRRDSNPKPSDPRVWGSALYEPRRLALLPPVDDDARRAA